MRNSPLVLREQAGEAFDAAQGLINVAESEQRDLTAAEKDLFDQHSATARAKIKDAERLEAHDDFGRWLGQSQGKVPLQRADNLDGPRIPGGSDRPKPTPLWHDANGQPIWCLGPQERLSDLPLRGDKEYDPQLSMGRAMIAMVTGDWKRAPREVKAM